jgi:uncharacterized protein YbjT (DUF2867 family)/membrane protease YdiL (CAAX protease family)
MKVLVAGASGFVGRHVVAVLLERGHEVVAVSRRPLLRPGVRSIVADVARAPLPSAALDGVDAVVNLIGIKREEGAQTFAAVHVAATRNLVESCHDAGIRRVVHVSVVGSRPDPSSLYHDTKWRAEEVLRESGLAVTILKPSVIYGAGDDMSTHLTKMIRVSPVFPIVGRGTSLLQPVSVLDVAEAVARGLERPATADHAYDIVGPERLTLRRVVRIVAEARRLPLWIVPMPVLVMRPMVALMSRLFRAPLSTPAQLRMLEEGLVGDPEPARRELGLSPRPFTVEAVPALPADPAAAAFPRALLVAGTAALLMPLLSLALASPWYRMTALGIVLTALALAVVPLPWRELSRPSVRHVLLGVLSAVALYGAGAVVVTLLQGVTGAPMQIAALYAWRDLVPRAVVFPLLVLIVLGEEIVWRNAVTLPFAARLGPWRGAALAAAAFALAHVTLGVPVLLAAAFGAGLVWSAMVVATRSAVPAFVGHLLWDIAVLFVRPYAG